MKEYIFSPTWIVLALEPGPITLNLKYNKVLEVMIVLLTPIVVRLLWGSSPWKKKCNFFF